MFTNEVGKIKHRKMGSFLHDRGEVGNFIENTFFFYKFLEINFFLISHKQLYLKNSTKLL